MTSCANLPENKTILPFCLGLRPILLTNEEIECYKKINTEYRKYCLSPESKFEILQIDQFYLTHCLNKK